MRRGTKTTFAKTAVCISIIAALVCLLMTGCDAGNSAINYSAKENWAYFEVEKAGTKADVFFICPTVYFGDDEHFNMSLADEETKASFLGATNMEKGIYDAQSRFLAPYYRQIGLNVYGMEPEKQEIYSKTAYSDIKAAFEYYLHNVNSGRPIILAGFSQGADLCIRLLKDCFQDEKTNDLLVACYAIGWRVTEEEMEKYPHLTFATGENDIGVIVSFNSEDASIVDSMIVPKGTKALAINPLNWRTDAEKADKTENLGACFTDYSGNITAELANLTGAYIEPIRGTLKVTDVNSEEYPAVLDIFEDGIYHLYDYQFFYRNLQDNVARRLEAYLASK